MRNRYILLADLVLIAVAAFGAFILRFDWLFFQNRPEFLPFLAAALLIKPPVFYLFGMYARYWRYANAQDLVAVTLAVSTSSTAMAIAIGAVYASKLVPIEVSRPVVLIDWFLTLALAGGIRMSVKVVGEAQDRSQKTGTRTPRRRVLVVGAGEAGTLVVREMQRNPQLGLYPVAFLDDAPVKLRKRIQGVRVAGPIDALPQVLKRERIDQVVVAMPTAAGSVVRAVADACRRAGVASRVVPGVFELLDGNVSVSRLRTVDIADLLRRPQLAPGGDSGRYLRGRTVLVTGAGGSIGAELTRQAAFAGPRRLVLLGHGENSIFEVRAQLAEQYPAVDLVPVIADIRDRPRIDRVFAEFRPHVVFHAAAHKHVPLMEDNPEEAIGNNVLGTASVVEAAERHDVERLVMISTDKAVAPTSIMGASKRLAESVVEAAASRSGRPFVVVRFGNVLGSRGSVVPFFKRQIERGGPVTVTHPGMKRFFMTVPEAVHLVLEAGGMAAEGGVFVLDMGQPVAITELARDLIRLSGFGVEEIGIEYTGVRPGEKLEEALWERDAVVEPTGRPDVLRVHEARPLGADLAVLLPAFDRALGRGDRGEVERLVAGCFPTFVPRPAAIVKGLQDDERRRPRPAAAAG